MSGRTKCVFGAVAFCAAGMAVADFVWSPDLVVARDESVVLGPECIGRTNTSLTVHGNLTFNYGNRWKPSFVFTLGANGQKTTDSPLIAVGPDAGDDATLELQRSEVNTFFDNGHGLTGNLEVGANGGNGRVHLHVSDSTGAGGAKLMVRQVRLAAEARTEADVFDVVRLGADSELSMHKIRNDNAKPMRVTFENREGASTGSGLITLFVGGQVADLPVDGGDLIFAGAPAAPIRFQTWSGWYYRFFGSNDKPKGCVRFEGDCDVVFGTGHHDVIFNKTNVVWNQTGNLVVTPDLKSALVGKFVVEEADVLPCGPQTGNVVVRSWPGAGTNLVMKLNQTSQNLNGLLLENGAALEAPAGTTLTFGTGDADGVLAGALTNETVTCVKTGAGRLALSNATVRALSVTDGTLGLCAGTSNRVGTLAVTNVAVLLAPNATLDVETWALGPNVRVETVIPATLQTNEMVTVYSTTPGIPLVKEGDGFVTCATVADAQGTPLHVKGGVLRMGGCVCTNTWWRFVVKRAMADVHHFTDSSVPEFSRDVTLMLGSIGLFSPAGLQCMDGTTGKPDGTAADQLAPGEIASAKPVMRWDLNEYKKYHPTATRDPILGGGSAIGGVSSFVPDTAANGFDWRTTNCFDKVATSDKTTIISSWPCGILFTNAVIRPDSSDTWETISWRVKDSWTNNVPASYALRRCVNNDGWEMPHATDWSLESSANGVDWEVMDVRTNQTFTRMGEGPRMSAQFNYTYNGHVPYVFSAKNANWMFDTYGAVQVDAGAVLDMGELRTENIAFNALKVDCIRGAGTITKFVPAVGGTLFLVNAPVDAAGRLRAHVDTGLTFGMVADADNLKTWKVHANGVRSSASRVSIRDGRLVVDTAHGTLVILK